MNNRPLSPHLQVYRLPLTALVSITHRATGVWLTLGLALFVMALVQASGGEAAYLRVQACLSSWPGLIFVWAWIFSLLFHLCHGIRHLVWDTGHGFEKSALNLHSGIELAAAVALTAMTYLLG